MVEALLVEDSGGRIRSFRGKGHAGRGAPGSDPACAAFSLLARTAWEALDGIEGVAVDGDAGAPGELSFTVTSCAEAARDRVAGLTDFFRAGLRSLEREYPGSFRIMVQKEGRDRNG